MTMEGEEDAGHQRQFVALLGLKRGAVLSLDGGQPLMLQTDDFVGFDLSSSSSTTTTTTTTSPQQQHRWHLITAKPSDQAAVTTGFVIESSSSSQSKTSNHLNLVRQYDPQTEEMSSSSPTDPQTVSNLEQQFHNNQIEPHRLLPYHQVVSKEQESSWTNSVKWVSPWLLQRRGGLRHGTKLVPGSYQEEDDKEQGSDNIIVDGSQVKYPHIPIMIHPEKGVSRSRSHRGTRAYLATLTPTERTALFLDTKYAEERLLQNILEQQYQNDWQHLVGDVQLSFVIFLHLKCLHSLEHWRDLVVLLSSVGARGILRNQDLYQGLVQVLMQQVPSFDRGFLEELEVSEGSFFTDSLRRLSSTLHQIILASSTTKQEQNGQSQTPSHCLSEDLISKFQMLLSNVLPNFNFQHDDRDTYTEVAMMDGEDEFIMELDSSDLHKTGQWTSVDDSSSKDDDDDDMAVVVSSQEIEASLARTANTAHYELGRGDKSSSSSLSSNRVDNLLLLRMRYPLLMAALQPHEDVMMLCARVLDEKLDVSLVREAAAYLEEQVGG